MPEHFLSEPCTVTEGNPLFITESMRVIVPTHPLLLTLADTAQIKNCYESAAQPNFSSRPPGGESRQR